MHVFWKSVIEPLLKRVQPAVIVEVGCDEGACTQKLVDHCRVTRGDLHVIDPAPRLDPLLLKQWQSQKDFGFRFHRRLSLEALPELSRVDVALLDGDHNWHTVYHELQTLEAMALNQGHLPPLILLHDVDWPYGRRDLYYNPESIPEETRQPMARGGLHPQFNGQVAHMGLNAGAIQAEREGGERNGVLTAVEDYLQEAKISYERFTVPAFFGLGILCPTERLEQNEELAHFLRNLESELVKGGLLQTLEEERLRLLIDNLELHRAGQVSPELLEAYAEGEDYLPALEWTFDALTNSLRWKLGNGIVSSIRTLLLRKKEPQIPEHLDRIVQRGKERMRQRLLRGKKTASASTEVATQTVDVRTQLHALPTRTSEGITRDFHRLYYQNEAQTWRQTTWMGTPAYKCPLDLWVYQEILHETRPDLILETGTCQGGSALYLAHVCDLLGQGEVVTIDINPGQNLPEHERITYLHGSSTSPEILRKVTEKAAQAQRVMVILDSDHSRDHVLAELQAYAPLVNQDCFLIVEDTNVNGHPVLPEHGPGPYEALEEFLQHNSDFEREVEREKFFLTFNPRGFLRRLTARPTLRA